MARAGSRRLLVGIDASRAQARQPTGTERYAQQVIRHLVAAGDHEYRLYSRDRPDEPAPAPAEVRVLAAPRLWSHTRLAFEVARHPPDVLFVPAHVMPWWCRPPAVVTVHDLGYLAYPAAHPWRQRAYLDLTTRRHARRAARLIADSAATRDDLVARYGAEADRIAVVHLGVDEAMRPPSPGAVAAARRALGLASGRNYLLHVGTRQPRKNLGRLIEAFARIAARHPALDLVLAGRRGWGGDDPAVRAAAGQLAGRVVVAGYVERSLLPGLYGGALALVMPSLYEGFGLPVVEAMACGTPVAASRTSSLPEIGGEAALYFEPLDVAAIAAAIERLVVDADLRARLAAAGERRAAGFTWRRCARGVQAAIEAAAP